MQGVVWSVARLTPGWAIVCLVGPVQAALSAVTQLGVADTLPRATCAARALHVVVVGSAVVEVVGAFSVTICKGQIAVYFMCKFTVKAER